MENPNPTPTPAPVPAPTPEPAPAPEKTFTQAEVDTILGKRLAKAMKGMPSEEELTKFRAWQTSQQTEQERLAAITKERDESKTALAEAETRLEQLTRERYVLSKGLTGDEAEFIAFKAAKLVNDKTTFEQAVDSLAAQRTPEQKKPAFDWTAPIGGGGKTNGANDAMNALIRSAWK